jgi:hypothetical protein
LVGQARKSQTRYRPTGFLLSLAGANRNTYHLSSHSVYCLKNVAQAWLGSKVSDADLPMFSDLQGRIVRKIIVDLLFAGLFGMRLPQGVVPRRC